MATYVPLSNVLLQLQDTVTSANLSGGKIEFFLAGTATPTDLFSDNIGTSIGPSITLNSGGIPESGGNTVMLWRDASIALKLVFKNAALATIHTEDNIPAAGDLRAAPWYDITAAETAAGVTPTDNLYQAGCVRRYTSSDSERSGSADATTAVQAALDSGSPAHGWPGDVYLVSQSGTKTIDSVANRYCCSIPTGQSWRSNGAEVKLDAGQNASIFINDGAGTGQDADIFFDTGDAWLNGNNANQTTPATGEMPLVKFYDVDRLYVARIKAKGARDYFARFLKCRDPYIGDLWGTDSDGDGWSFGVSGTNNLIRAEIGDYYAEDCKQAYGSLQGNPALFTLEDSVVGNGLAVNCAGGWKIQSPTLGLTTFNSLRWKGGANNTTNSGTKIQGSATTLDATEASGQTVLSVTATTPFIVGYKCWVVLDNGDIHTSTVTAISAGDTITIADALPSQATSGNEVSSSCGELTIAQVITDEADAEGLRFLQCRDVSVGSYIGRNNGQAGTNADVSFDDDAYRCYVGSVSIDGAGSVGIINSGADCGVGHAVVRNSGQVSANANATFAAACKNGYFGKLLSIDDQGTPTATRGLNRIAGSTGCAVKEYDSHGDYTATGAHFINGGDTDFQFGTYRIDGALIYSALSDISSAGNVGAGEDDLLSLTIPAHSFYDDGKGYDGRAWGFIANNANAKTLKLYIGSTAIASVSMTVSQAYNWEFEFSVYRRTSLSTQAYVYKLYENGTIIDHGRGDLTETGTAAITVKCTGTATADDDIAQRGMTMKPL